MCYKVTSHNKYTHINNRSNVFHDLNSFMMSQLEFLKNKTKRNVLPVKQNVGQTELSFVAYKNSLF
jgi:hypothetical protein